MTKSKQPKNLWQKFLGLHEHKKYLEFFTALLSIPVLVTVIILNLNTLKNTNKNAEPTNTPTKGGFFSAPIESEPTTPTEVSVTPSAPCKKELGPVNIDSPEEGDTIMDNPVSVVINYDDEEYCAAVWSYRINGSSWSEYDNKSIALYNLPQGKVKFELKVKSVVSKEETTLTRNFTYKGTSTAVTPTPTGSEQDQLGTSTSAPTPN